MRDADTESNTKARKYFSQEKNILPRSNNLHNEKITCCVCSYVILGGRVLNVKQ